MNAHSGINKQVIKMTNEKNDKQRKEEEKTAEEIFKNLHLQLG